MKNHPFLLLFLLIMPAAHGQHDSLKSINVYFNAFFFEEFKTPVWLNGDDARDIYYSRDYVIASNQALSVGVQWNGSKNNVMELEFMPFRYVHCITRNQEVTEDSTGVRLISFGDTDYRIMNSYTRYSYIPLYRMKKFIFMPKLSVKPFFYYMSVDPNRSNEFFTAEWKAGAMLEFIPGLQYRINKKLGIQMGFPLTLLSVGYEREKHDHPALPLNKRISDKFFLRKPDHQWQLQIGLMYSI